MESQIEQLLEKYWNGETSLEEEKKLKIYFQSNPSLTEEGHYFRYLSGQKKVTYNQPRVSFFKRHGWLSAAATIALGVLTALLVFNDAKKDPFAVEDPKAAFEATKNALMMIGGKLQEAKDHSLELTKINKAKEELQEDS